ncbi:MAG: DegT/DnrJ/EryC1/StrS family aminotransferase [Actinomycetota bacterium]
MAELAINGGTAVRPQGYPAWPVWSEREIEAVTSVVRSGEWGGYPEPGVHASAFEERFAAYQGAAHGVLMVNGTITMEVALKALDIGWGDEVIIPALTFVATAYAPMAAGALPVIVDVEPRTWTIDPDAVEAAVTERTRAILPVHLGHHMADMDRVMDIAKRHGLAVIEDCAHAPGQRWKDAGAGCIGSFGSFSHQSSKILTSGEGGSLLTKDEGLARRAHSIVDCGRPKDAEEREFTFGANYRLGELHAALLLPQLDRFEAQRIEREGNARYLEEIATSVPGVHVMKADERITRWSFYNYILRIDPDEFGAENEAVCAALEAEGIPGEVQYPPMSRYDLFQPSRSRLPVAVEFADRLDPSKMTFPVAEAAGLRESIYFMENTFRAGREGIEDVVEALAKIHKHVDELRPSTQPFG